MFQKRRIQCQSCGKWFQGESVRYKSAKIQ
jgi:uncharacterized protein (DUF2225 family)